MKFSLETYRNSFTDINSCMTDTNAIVIKNLLKKSRAKFIKFEILKTYILTYSDPISFFLFLSLVLVCVAKNMPSSVYSI